MINLSENTLRKISFVKYDPVNRILSGEWHDNKTVLCTSLLGVSGWVTVKRGVGSHEIDLEIEESLKAYTQENFIG